MQIQMPKNMQIILQNEMVETELLQKPSYLKNFLLNMIRRKNLVAKLIFRKMEDLNLKKLIKFINLKKTILGVGPMSLIA